MTKQRKQHSKEFKLEMVKPIEEQNQRVVDIAKQICFNGALYAPYALPASMVAISAAIALPQTNKLITNSEMVFMMCALMIMVKIYFSDGLKLSLFIFDFSDFGSRHLAAVITKTVQNISHHIGNILIA